MVKQLSQRSTLSSSASLCAIHCVKCLIEEETDGPRQVNPWRAVGIESWIVPQHREDIDDHEAESSESDLRSGLELYLGGIDVRFPHKIGPASTLVSTWQSMRSVYSRHRHWEEFDNDIGIEWF